MVNWRRRRNIISYVCYYISFVLLINWIPLTGQEILIVCGFVVIDFVCDVITWCAVFVRF